MSTKKELPAWFYRVNALTYRSEDEVLPHYFDEDISDLENDDASEDDDASDSDVEYWCECDSEDQDCPHQAEDNEEMSDHDDKASERSFDGSVADWYYELKSLREDRKRELRSFRKAEAKEKQKAIEYDSRKVEEVRAAYEALKKAKREGETLYMGSLVGKHFQLYSVDHIEYRWPGLQLSKFVVFYHPHADSPMLLQQAYKNGRRAVEGQVYLDVNAGCEFPLFRPPTRPRRRKHVLDCHCGKHKFVFQFIGDEHLILKVSRDLVFEGYEGPVPESAPEIFEFMGILRNEEKEKLEREEKKLEREKERLERESRISDTLFDLNHPMGW
ncbi:hypothetical protein LX32DRAFT_637862 [Colletotrichum zoysiae]|uniref:Uncharacterized protein n=1 Tax=Colletotrichum zoysiae TaxID=1216348 RepID=A0AAD9HL21_9PEZI|nr:hypothetical protein LX32DRAFT_637862 [Colletotrichum zoysiae]